MAMNRATPPLPASDLEHILQHTRELWMETKGKKFFITGGTGFFGAWLLESLACANDQLNLGLQAIVLSRDPAGFKEKAPHIAKRADIEFLTGDIRDFPFPKGQFDYIVHAATEASAKSIEEQPAAMLDTIIAGTRRVLEFAAAAETQKLLLTSSGAVYGRQPSEITHINETYPGAPDPLLPGSCYRIGKRVAEHMAVVQSETTSLETKIARCFAFVGPHLPLDTHFAVGNFIRDARAGAVIRVSGDGTAHRSYLYAADLTVWLWTILFRGASCRAYNVGSSQSVSIAELAHIVNKTLNRRGVVIEKTPTPGAAPSRYVPDTSRAETELNLRQLVPFEQALLKTSAWLDLNQKTHL